MISIWIIFCLKWSENFFFQYWSLHLAKVFPTSLEISGCLNNCINIHKVRMFLLRELVVLFSLSVWVSQCCEQKRDHCRQCDDKSKCKVCEDGYFLTPNDQTCQKCPLGCSQCLFGSESVECFSCLPTFKLSHSECILRGETRNQPSHSEMRTLPRPSMSQLRSQFRNLCFVFQQLRSRRRNLPTVRRSQLRIMRWRLPKMWEMWWWFRKKLKTKFQQKLKSHFIFNCFLCSLQRQSMCQMSIVVHRMWRVHWWLESYQWKMYFKRRIILNNR